MNVIKDLETNLRNSLILCVVIFFFLAISLIIIKDRREEIKELKKTAVELNHAFYNTKTAEFTWVTNKTEK